MSEPAIRTAERRDLPALRAIFNHYVEGSTASFRTVPESEAERLAWFAAHGERYPAIVAEDANEILGWACVSPWKATGGYANSVELSVYLREDARGRKLGTRLLVELMARARTAGHHVIIGGACTEQVASMKLHESLGFTRVAHFREVGFKFGRWLDVAYFQKVLEPREF